MPKKYSQKVKTQPKEWGKLFANQIADKVLVLRIYIELVDIYNKKMSCPI